MVSKFTLLNLLPLVILLLNFPARITPQECAYPCYPPPTGPTGNNPTPATTTTPPTPQGGYVPNPPSTTYQPPPSGYNNIPYLNSPPNDYGNGEAPPPPEPIVPWFPFYYRKPPHSDLDQSSSSRTTWKKMISLLVVVIFFV
ncbi:hypothetical protein KY290_024140 [Solanum tuberosum]|uniref:Uncharacterized protein n=1 Tax=Solanum tuberosum TaxID=4113 RepID=A0ABQ7UPV0_SOLTU|nr:hypothetical protein KY285_022913 [Solanum tuberosum]KAH0753870.1 hypothetical protein KY290_024140 [Solanum tuberosum]